MIRQARSHDSQAVADIYNHYIVHSLATFEEQAVTAGEMEERIRETELAQLPYLVADSEGDIPGYAYASEWKGRCAYKYSVEISVYLAPDASGRGIGTQLYEALFCALRQRGLHVAIAGITLPNPASAALHEKFGMTKVAHFPEVGFKFGRWIDVGYWQVQLGE